MIKTHDLVEQYTPDTPQSHQCGRIAQQVQRNYELEYAVAGGEIHEQGKQTIIYVNYTSIFTHAVKAIQELSDIVKEHQEQIHAQKHKKIQIKKCNITRFFCCKISKVLEINIK